MAQNPAQLARIRADEVAGAYASLPAVLSSSVMSSCLVVYVVADVRPAWHWGLWVTLNCLLCALRFGFVHAYRRAAGQWQAPNEAALRPWQGRLVWGSAAAGVLWGYAGAALAPASSFELQFLLSLVAVVMATSSAYSSASYPPAFYAFFVPCILPVTLSMLLHGDRLRFITGVMLCVYLPVFVRFGRQNYRVYTDSLRLRYENLDLVQELRRESAAAAEANIAKSRFLAAASHDLRQPLNALGLFLQSLKQSRELPAREAGLIASMDKSFEAMDGLFGALLDVSKLDAGILQPRVGTFPVRQLLEHMRNRYAEAARAKGLRLRVVGSTAFVVSDPVLLDELISNLLSNAIRYTAKGGVLLGCRRVGQRLRIEVWDSGIGIPADQHEEIFREFAQLGNRERDREQGLGLGLAIVERLARLLGHGLSVRSEPGRGSVFRIELPLGRAEDHRPAAADALPVHALEGRLVVVIDDEAAIRQAMQSLLEGWNCEVVVAASGTEALQQLASATRPPDALVSDFRLRNDETGIAAITALRSEFNDDELPAVLVTGDTAPERLREAEASGIAMLHKPLNPAKLRALLGQLLREREAL